RTRGVATVPGVDFVEAFDVGIARCATRGYDDSDLGFEVVVLAVGVDHGDAPLAVEAGPSPLESNTFLLEPAHMAGVVPVGGRSVAAGENLSDVETYPRRVDARVAANHPEQLARVQQGLGGHAGPLGAFHSDQRGCDGDQR